MGLRYARAAFLACAFALAACGGGGGGADSSGSSSDGGGDPTGGGGGGTDPPPIPAAYPDIPATDADAARFLTQATFGPTDAEIANLRTIGYSKWLDEQLSDTTAPPTLVVPFLDQLVANGILRDDIKQQDRRNYWLWQAATAHDQLRLRTGFALSQIFVVSDLELAEGKAEEAFSAASYQDLLTRNAFGTYRAVIEDVTLHPAMGFFLTYVGNRKTDATNNIAPDENYGREVMQLMSIGLYQRNPDFSPILDSNGITIPTYDQSVVSGMSRVFTGWTYAGQTDKQFGQRSSITDLVSPMECHPTYHDTAPKQIFDGIVVDEGSDCAADLSLTLDALAAHPNVAPFISRELIQRFVTSNPSPAYITRVTDVWIATDGNLGQVVRAILLDNEARLPPPDESFGKAREPLIKVATLWRAFGASYVAPATGQINFGFTGGKDFTATISQDSLRAPSVFNFFSPNFRLPSSDGTGIYAPEFQILTEATYLGALAQHDDLIWLNTADQPPPVKLAPILDLSDLIAMAEAENYTGMVDKVNLLLFDGSMSADSQQMMSDMLDQLAVVGQTPSECARSLLEVAYDSPEFAVQR